MSESTEQTKATSQTSTAPQSTPAGEEIPVDVAASVPVPPPSGFVVQYGFVFSAAGLMLMGVWVVSTWIQSGLRGGAPQHHLVPAVRLGPLSHGTRTDSMPRVLPATAVLALQTVPSTRTLKQYYARRAYPGAPPSIPHPVARLHKGQPLRCLSCHEEGGYVPQYQAYTPVTPHPELQNCVQCHTPQGVSPAFRDSAWLRPRPPKLGKSALPGGPPVIPHSLQMRTNCLACHAGPAAPKEIRTPHPQRIYCTQCHVPQQGKAHFRSTYGVNLQPAKHLAPTTRRRRP